MNERYIIDLEFDTEGEPPHVFIWDMKDGGQIAEILEEPSALDDQAPYSWVPEDWQPGPLARRILKSLNDEEGVEASDERQD